MGVSENLKNVCKSFKNDSLAERVYGLLETSILNMELKPGDVLSEDELAETLKVSRSPVREALLKLEHVGLVKKERKSRTVAGITEETIIHNYHMWSMTESYAAGLACLEATEEDIINLKCLVDQMEEKLGEMNTRQYREQNDLFHMAMVAPCPDKKLVEMHKNAMAHIRWGYNYTLTWPEEIGHSNAQHQELYHLYKDKDRAGVEQVIREHTDNAGKRLRALFLKKYNPK